MIYNYTPSPYPPIPRRKPSHMYFRNGRSFSYQNQADTLPLSSLPSPKQEQEKKKENPLFNFGGVSLYFDDVLLICLIFFLYQEGVKDKELLLILILLLLS